MGWSRAGQQGARWTGRWQPDSGRCQDFTNRDRGARAGGMVPQDRQHVRARGAGEGPSPHRDPPRTQALRSWGRCRALSSGMVSGPRAGAGPRGLLWRGVWGLMCMRSVEWHLGEGVVSRSWSPAGRHLWVQEVSLRNPSEENICVQGPGGQTLQRGKGLMPKT